MGKKLKGIALAMFAVCAFMAVSAGAAQATPNWTVETSAGHVIIPSSSESFELTCEPGCATAASTLNVPGLLELKGTGVEISGAKIFGEKFDTVKKITFNNVVAAGGLGEVCSVRGSGDAKGSKKVSTTALSTELVTIGKIAYDTFKPEEGTTFVTIVFEGASCPVAGNFAITGSIVGTVPASGALATANNLVFTEADQKVEAVEKLDALKFGTSPAYLTVTVPLMLSNDDKWGVDW